MANKSVTSQDWSQIFAKAWSDPSYADLLRTDPTAAVRQHLKVHDDTLLDIFLVPPRPADLTDEQLEGVVKGTYNIAMPYCC
ncbi:MAG: hypothetical protein ABSB67_07985 [Bryobacteraceae bacterium]|jgi:hypothetical protein